MKKIIDFTVSGLYANSGTTGTVVNSAGSVDITAPVNTTTRARIYPTAHEASRPFIFGSNAEAFRLVFTAKTNPSSIKMISVYISLDVGYAASGFFKVSANNFVYDENQIVFFWSDFYATAGTSIEDIKSKPIVSWQVALTSSATEAASISVKSFDAIPAGRGAVVIMADDANIEQDYMGDLLNGNGFRGAMSVAVIPEKIGTAGYMTKDHLRKMKRDGSTLCNHTYKHTILGAATESIQRDETRLCSEWLERLELGDSPNILVFPQGNYNRTTLSIVDERFIAGRTVAEGANTPYGDPRQLKIINLLPTVTVETVKKYIDRATNNGVGVIFLLHRLMDGEPDANTPTTFWVKKRLIEVVNYAREVNAPVMNLKRFVTEFLQPSDV